MSSSATDTQLRRVAVVGGSRIPFARSDGPCAGARPEDRQSRPFSNAPDGHGEEAAQPRPCTIPEPAQTPHEGHVASRFQPAVTASRADR
ncbi:hypothetical protein GCM10022206_92580 [Streptomyces chiangmaiensis]